MNISDHPVLWQPTEASIEASALTKFVTWAKNKGAPQGRDYEAVHRWSVADLPRFWTSIFEYFELPYSGDLDPVLRAKEIESARWCTELDINYVERIFENLADMPVALYLAREGTDVGSMSGTELLRQVGSLQRKLVAAGVSMGDRVVGFLPNTEHAIVAFLATASLGAVWSCCSPDFGEEAVRDRFEQIEPKVLIACKGYGYGGKRIDRTAVIDKLSQNLPTVSARVLVELDTPTGLDGWENWADWTSKDIQPSLLRVPFSHPLWILFSSGTTGKPKAIVHGHGGSLLEHVKYLSLQADVKASEHFFWFTTTGWMMWNFLQASLLVKAIPVLFDGSPGYPALTRLWRLAESLPVHHFGTSAPFIHACLKKDHDIASEFDLSALRSIGSTGSPLSEEGFAYVYEKIKADVWLTSMSGGTDVCTAFVGGNPWTQVRRGVIQGRALGCDLIAGNEVGQPVIGELGELLVKKAMPSMPVQFWGDINGERRHESYFEDYPGFWRHGDWITINDEGGVVIHGRSDATLNRQGVRMGTAEIYRVVDTFPEITDSVIINYQDAAGEDYMPLFVVLAAGEELTGDLTRRIKKSLREENSPRHVPTSVVAVSDIPYTISGKKLEAPIKKLFMGRPLHTVAKLGSLKNPAALEYFAQLAQSS